MIIEVKMWTVQCDNCGENWEDKHSGFAAWNDSGYALECAKDSGWNEAETKEFENQHYCPTCWILDEDDNVIPIPKATT